jgi:hypothetical protein
MGCKHEYFDYISDGVHRCIACKHEMTSEEYWDHQHTLVSDKLSAVTAQRDELLKACKELLSAWEGNWGENSTYTNSAAAARAGTRFYCAKEQAEEAIAACEKGGAK